MGYPRGVYAVGQVIGGKFRVDRVLGEGGMGTVLAATHLQLDQVVALKVMLATHVADAGLVQRFLREAQASAKLRSEYVCRVSDVGTLDSGAPYIVMELLQGRDLWTMLAQDGPLPTTVAAELLLQACIGLAEAHAHGIVHRDLKSTNLFLTTRPDGTHLVKVLDFGIAKLTSQLEPALTRTHTVMGSPFYMSPEQMRASRDVDARSDIWALGVILYELVTGTLPWSAEAITELAVKVATEEPTSLAEFGRPELDPIMRRCLSKAREGRYADVAELAAALAPLAGPKGPALAEAASRVLGEAGVPRTTVLAGPTPELRLQPTTLGIAVSAIDHAPKPARRSGLWVSLGLLLVGGIGLAGYLATRGPVEAAGTTAPPAPPAVDAAPAVVLPADAAVDAPSTDAGMPVDATPAKRPTTKKPPPATPPVTQPPTKPPKDLGESRK